MKMEPTVSSETSATLHSPAYEDGADSEFRNVVN